MCQSLQKCYYQFLPPSQHLLSMLSMAVQSWDKPNQRANKRQLEADLCSDVLWCIHTFNTIVTIVYFWTSPVYGQNICNIYVYPQKILRVVSHSWLRSVCSNEIPDGGGGNLQTKISDPAKYQAKSEISQTLKVVGADNKTLWTKLSGKRKSICKKQMLLGERCKKKQGKKKRKN